MDLSFLKWPAILGAIALIGWLASSGGVNYMYNKFTTGAPGANAEMDAVNEAGLCRLGGYCLTLFKYEKAKDIYHTALTRYPEGKNKWWMQYQMARCAENLEEYQACVDLLRDLILNEANSKDERVPNNDNLRLRIDKLVEMHELEKR